jgi:hypothetical protein
VRGAVGLGGGAVAVSGAAAVIQGNLRDRPKDVLANRLERDDLREQHWRDARTTRTFIQISAIRTGSSLGLTMRSALSVQ